MAVGRFIIDKGGFANLKGPTTNMCFLNNKIYKPETVYGLCQEN
jgi:hypothetical protein